MYTFGKDIEYKLYAYESGEKLPIIPAQGYDVHIYDSKPSRADAFIGVGALASIVATHTSGQVLDFTIPALSDPDPDSSIRAYNYFLAIVFKLQDSEQSQLIIRALPIERVHGKDKTIGVTLERIKEAYPDVNAYVSDDNIEAFIRLAQTELMQDLRNKGFHWAEINQPSQLFNALLFKSLWYIHSSQIQRMGDRFSVNADMAHKNYDSTIRALQIDIAYDDDKAVKQNVGGAVWLSR